MFHEKSVNIDGVMALFVVKKNSEKTVNLTWSAQFWVYFVKNKLVRPVGSVQMEWALLQSEGVRIDWDGAIDWSISVDKTDNS